MTATKQHDNLNRLASIASVPSGASPITYGYSLNNANQRVRCSLADGSCWVYQYDALGQVKSGKKYWADGTPVAGQQFEYAHDDIGNRTLTKAGGDQNGANLRSAAYGANFLNQYTNRTVPGAVEVSGLALATNSVSINSQAPYRKGEYFRQVVAVDNTNGPVWQAIQVSATGEADVNGKVFVPQTPEFFYHDADGNLTNDGRWIYTWDAENRLVSMVSGTNAPAGSERKLTFAYDWQGRRVRLGVSVWTNNAWKVAVSNRFVCDGWNLVAELNATNMNLIRAYTWGLDLSGTLQGAGGVGGLLAVSDAAQGSHFAGYDGNGNVAALVQAGDGSISARYEYGPFGELVRMTGPLAKANPFRFSTKYQDDETDLLYFGYRYYTASTGKWLSRDPIKENGGPNLYGFVANSPQNAIDPFGLHIVCNCPESYFKENGITPEMYTKSGNTYTAKPNVSFNGSGVGEILWKMLLTSHTFKVRDQSVEKLKRHVAARQTIVKNALNANFVFGTGVRQDWTGFTDDPQAYYDKLNDRQTTIACQALSKIIFETGNNFGKENGGTWAEGRRSYDSVWIPGDWGWIRNAAYTDGDDWKTEDGQNRGVQGENVFYTGGGLFWGHFMSGKHPAQSESQWWDEVKSWTSKSGKHGIPQWRDYVKHPTTGLEK